MGIQEGWSLARIKDTHKICLMCSTDQSTQDFPIHGNLTDGDGDWGSYSVVKSVLREDLDE